MRGLPPVVDERSRVLVLGSMPGVVSLAAGEYYAHPRNLFWRLMDEILGVDRAAPYAARIEQLLARRVALWDVLASCTRAGSLDASIDSATMVTNDFARFFAAHPTLRTVCFNGATAAATFRRHVLGRLDGAEQLRFHALPSTSPANAAVPLTRKRAAWQVVDVARMPPAGRAGPGTCPPDAGLRDIDPP